MLALSAAPMILRSQASGSGARSDKITLGCIGLGNHGHGVNLLSFLQEPDCRVVAVCDVYKDRREISSAAVNQHYAAQGCRMFADFRELIASNDIDAVVISTPDHWHVPMALRALEAGKKVFCEKPTLTIAEGRELADKVREKRAIFSTGLEDRSLIHYHKMAEAVRNGAIGRLQHIDVGLPTAPIIPLEEPAPVPEGLNFDLWLGPAPHRAYTPNLTRSDVWRQIRDFSGGILTDWGAHLIDTAQVGNFSENSGPVAVTAHGEIPPHAMNSVPRTFELNYTYANGVTMTVRSDIPSIRFNGTEGWVGNRTWMGQLEASDLEIYRRVYDPATNKLWPRPPSEHRNFLDAIRGSASPIYSAEALHRLSTVMHIGSIAMELGRPLKWDPTTETFDDPAANQLKQRTRREEWA